MDILTGYSFEIIWKPGIKHEIPDILSRLYDEEEKVSLGTLALRDDSARKSLDPIKDQKKINELIREVHDDEGHFGIKSMLEKIWNRGYTWKSIIPDLDKHIRGCSVCAKYNLKKGFHPYITEEYVFPLERVSVDVIGKLNTTPDGFTRILVMVDSVTKYVWLRALKSKDSKEIAEAMFDIFSEWGFPNTILSDGGKEFSGECIRLLKLLRIERRITAPYNPHSNGEVEAQCKIVFQTIRKLCSEVGKDLHKRDNWDRFVRSAQFLINSKTNAITRSCPFELMLGPRGSNFPTDVEERRTISEDKIKEYWEEVYNFIYPNLSREVKLRKERIGTRYNSKKKGSMTKFRVGDVVMLESKEVSLGERGKKLEPLYTGPYIVARLELLNKLIHDLYCMYHFLPTVL